jgi:putative multiple sugar transport system substrate-binding protein
MRKKMLGVVLSVAMVATLLTGCGKKEEPAAPADDTKQEAEQPADDSSKDEAKDEAKDDAADEEKKDDAADSGSSEGGLVGVAMPTKDLQRWNQDGSNMEEKLKAAGYEVDLQYASNDVSTQVSQIENMIANGCKVLVIASIEGDSLGTVLEQAQEKDIKVIAYDRLIMNSPAVSYYATFDNNLVGQKQGEYIKDKLDLDNAGDKTYNIEFVTGDPGDNNVNFFFGGAMDVLQPYLDSGVLKCPSGQTSKDECATPEWSSEKAQTRFENILSSNYADGTKLDAVLCSNDSTAQGVAAALEANYTGDYPIVTGQDCDIVSVKNMIDGKQSMSIFKDTRTLADKVVGMVDAIMKGSEPEINDKETYDNGDHVVPSYLCEPVFADINNYKEILIDSGYYSEDDLK